MMTRRRGGGFVTSLPRRLSIWTLLTVLLWTVSFIMLPTRMNGFWTPKAMLWLVGSFLLASSIWWNTPTERSLRNPWVGAIFVWVLLRWAWQTITPQLVLPSQTSPTFAMPWVTSSLYPTLICFGSLLAGDALVRHSDGVERWVSVAEQLCYVAAALAFYGLLQVAWCDPLHLANREVAGFIHRNDLITTFGNPMLTADFLVILSPLCLMFRPLRFKLIFGVILLDLLLIRSSGALLAWVVSTSLMAWAQRSRWLAGVVGLVVVSGMGYVGLHHQATWWLSDSGRFQLWQQAFSLWQQKAILQGFGVGAVEAAASNGYWTWASLHNEPLQLLFELGLIGSVLVVGMLVHLGRRLWQAERSMPWYGWVASALSFGVVSLVAFPLRIGATLMVGVCILAALETLSEVSDGAVSA